jgi:hypothetical protein
MLTRASYTVLSTELTYVLFDRGGGVLTCQPDGRLKAEQTENGSMSTFFSETGIELTRIR